MIYCGCFMDMIIWLWYLYKNNKKIFIIVFTLFFIWQSYLYLNYLYKNNKTLISQSELNDIKKINNIITWDYMMMVTHKNYSPWIHGYTMKETIAPWLFDWNIWWLNKWNKWWFSKWNYKCQVLKEYIEKYNKNVYIWLGERQPKSNYSWNCFEVILNKWKYKLLKVNKTYYENK